jgi:hypothetical protein
MSSAPKKLVNVGRPKPPPAFESPRESLGELTANRTAGIAIRERGETGRVEEVMQKRHLNHAISVRKARRRRYYEMSRGPRLAAPVAGEGIILPNGDVVLPRADGTTVLCGVYVTVGCRCYRVGGRGQVVEMAPDELAGLERCVRATRLKSESELLIAAE